MTVEIVDVYVYPQTDQVVNGYGRIHREYDYWCVDYTVIRPGYVDYTYCRQFSDEVSAREYAEGLS